MATWEIVNKATNEVVYTYESAVKQVFGGEWGRADLFDNRECAPPAPPTPPEVPLSAEEVLSPLVGLAQVLVDKNIVAMNELPQTIQDELAP